MPVEYRLRARAGVAVTITTAHKILIASAVALFALYAGWEFRRYLHGDPDAVLRSAGAAAVALGFAGYLRWFWRKRRG